MYAFQIDKAPRGILQHRKKDDRQIQRHYGWRGRLFEWCAFYQTFGDSALIPALQVDSGVPRLVDYKELKTVWRPDVSSCAELLPEWYLQSYLLGVPRLAIGYRESGEVVSRIEEKAIDEVLQDAKRYKMFNPAGAFGRAHATFSWLQKCHRSLEKTSYANHKFKLRIEANYKASLTRIRPFGATV